MYRQTSNNLSALLHLHLNSRLETWFQLIMQIYLQDETGNIQDF